MVYRPYPRRLESLTSKKAVLYPQLVKDPECLSSRGLNLRHPARPAGAL